MKGVPARRCIVAEVLAGLWQGFVAPFVFVVSLFKSDLNIYEVHNNGTWYNFGYLFGLACFLVVAATGHVAAVRLLELESLLMAAVTYLEAIRQGIWEEMERDPAVFCIGEDIGIYGGAFKVTEGLIDRFGPERVVDTPISEMAIVNASFGAALTGMRPVAEFQFMDFISCAFNQITNMLAKAHYRWARRCPWSCAVRPAEAFTEVRSTRRIPRPTSRTLRD